MLISPAFAQTAGAAPAGGSGLFFSGIFPMLLIFVVFYFMMIRPQQRRVKALQTAIGALKKGDTVVTAGGVVGKVTKVEDGFAELEIAANTRIRVVRATIAEVTPLGAKPAND